MELVNQMYIVKSTFMLLWLFILYIHFFQDTDFMVKLLKKYIEKRNL